MPRLYLTLMLIVLALACDAHSQDQMGFPKCRPDKSRPNLPPACVVADLEPLLKVQAGDSDLASLDVKSLKKEIGEDGGPYLDVRVTGGIPFPPIFDEIVRIEFAGRAICTGVALSRNIILTAAHCTCFEKESYRVYFAQHFVYWKDEPNREPRFQSPRLLARSPLAFQGYDCRFPDLPQPGRDLGLLFLLPTKLNLYDLDPQAPPTVSLFHVAELLRQGALHRVLIFGYGRTDDFSFPRGLVAAATRVRDPFCFVDQQSLGGCASFREFTLSNLASQLGPSVDSCDGDSGGPVYIIGQRLRLDGKVELHRLLVGITSRALGGVPQFGPGYCGGGGVYTSVSHPSVLKWLAVNGVPLEIWPNARRFAEKAIPYLPPPDDPGVRQ